jgi:hypothetical protein
MTIGHDLPRHLQAVDLLHCPAHKLRCFAKPFRRNRNHVCPFDRRISVAPKVIGYVFHFPEPARARASLSARNHLCSVV